ncbi:MAG: electron transfer flavoprotein beta subunit/FixA family protein [Dehalococcoidia bacterium]|nr:MAG: electron transfer flavoprotein beta subunit/FixA family protein [Dehalococcoidia bacterium]
MRIIVPLKQVPDMNQVKFDVEGGRVDRSSAGVEINPFDLHALEAAIQIKENKGGNVTAISMGPRRAESSLRDALARGADNAVLLEDRKFAGADTLATSYTIAGAIQKLGAFDLIICGEKTVDGDTGQVGPEIAEHLNIPHIAYVSWLEVSGETIVARCEMGGRAYTVESAFPVLLTVTKDVNVPRLPGFRNKITARKAAVEIWGTRELSGFADISRCGVRGSPTRVHRVIIPSEENRKGMIFRNTIDEAIAEIADNLLSRLN